MTDLLTSITPIADRFEKYFSGKYLGEVLRQCILKAHRGGVLFETLSEKLQTAGSCTTKHVSMLEK